MMRVIWDLTYLFAGCLVLVALELTVMLFEGGGFGDHRVQIMWAAVALLLALQIKSQHRRQG